jgi:competence protein ComEA
MISVPSLPVTRRQALVAALVLTCLLVLGERLFLDGRSASRPARRPAEPVKLVSSPRPKLVVHVVGAVRRPGLYRLSEGSRIADAVARAGGATARANLEHVNLAAPVGDGQQVVVPRRVALDAPSATGEETELAGPVSLSSATLEQLDALPGVGPVTAQKILDYRAQHGGFRSVDELDAVPGIGPARLEQLRELVTP